MKDVDVVAPYREQDAVAADDYMSNCFGKFLVFWCDRMAGGQLCKLAASLT